MSPRSPVKADAVASNSHKKTTVRVWTRVLKGLNRRCEIACLNRDAYLDRVLAHEASRLAEEAWVNSDRARRYLGHALKKLGKSGDTQETALVGLRLRVSTLDAVNAACIARKVNRDNFINRVFFLLTASRKEFIQSFCIDPHDYYPEIFDEGDDVKAVLLSPNLAAVAQLVVNDPFFGYRIALAEDSKAQCYDPGAVGRTLLSARIRPQAFGEKVDLTALDCHVPDSDIPNFPEYEQEQELSAQALRELGLELDGLSS